MISILLIIIFFTFYSLYATTNRVKVNSNLGIETYIQKHKKNTKAIGLLLFIISLVLAVYVLGLGVGLLFSVIAYMTLGGLVILLAPLQIINYKNIIIIGVFFFLIELFQQISSL